MLGMDGADWFTAAMGLSFGAACFLPHNAAGCLSPFAFIFITDMAGRFAYSYKYSLELENHGLVGINMVVWQVSVHLMALLGLLFWNPHPYTLALAGTWLVCCEISINAGYHRMWSHGSFAAHPAVRYFFAAFGAAASQNSILWWGQYHRAHHRWLDDPLRDPYAAVNGLWHTHCGWLFANTDHFNFPSGHNVNTAQRPWMRHVSVKDLKADPVVAWQHRWFIPLMYLMALGLPAWLGALWGDSVGGVLYAGMLRLVLNYHSIWLVNSASHSFGHQPFSHGNTSTDSHLLAVLTCGEGYHNRHHEFPEDYRHGARWYDFDPPKWVISALVACGLAWAPKKSKAAEEAGVLLQAKAAQAGVRLTPYGRVMPPGKDVGAGGLGPGPRRAERDSAKGLWGLRETAATVWPPKGLEARADAHYRQLARQGARAREDRVVLALQEVMDDFHDGNGGNGGGDGGGCGRAGGAEGGGGQSGGGAERGGTGAVEGGMEGIREHAAELVWGPRPSNLPACTGRDLVRMGVTEWVVLDGVVLDVGKFAKLHPGGAAVLHTHIGEDVSSLFHGVSHVHTQHARNQAATLGIAMYVDLE